MTPIKPFIKQLDGFVISGCNSEGKVLWGEQSISEAHSAWKRDVLKKLEDDWKHFTSPLYPSVLNKLKALFDEET